LTIHQFDDFAKQEIPSHGANYQKGKHTSTMELNPPILLVKSIEVTIFVGKFIYFLSLIIFKHHFF